MISYPVFALASSVVPSGIMPSLFPKFDSWTRKLKADFAQGEAFTVRYTREEMTAI